MIVKKVPCMTEWQVQARHLYCKVASVMLSVPHAMYSVKKVTHAVFEWHLLC